MEFNLGRRVSFDFVNLLQLPFYREVSCVPELEMAITGRAKILQNGVVECEDRHFCGSAGIPYEALEEDPKQKFTRKECGWDDLWCWRKSLHPNGRY